jgi:putative transposase
LKLFEKKGDYDAFEKVLAEAQAKFPLPLLAYCLMPNHWHFVVRPESDHQVTDFFRWLTTTHTVRWHAHHRTIGTGHLYQDRFKSFPVECNHHLLAVLRYVERNPVRAGLAKRAELWRYGSAWCRAQAGEMDGLLAPWPIPRPRNWDMWVNSAPSESELAALRRSSTRGAPFGSENWISQSAARLSLEHTLRPVGRPKKG